MIMMTMRTMIMMMITQVRRRRESRELALNLAQQELADVLGRLEAAQERGAEQVDDDKYRTTRSLGALRARLLVEALRAS